MPVESIGPIYETKIPGLADAADIQAAFYAYHYGAYTSVATTAGIITPSMAKILKDIEADIATLEARPSSGGDATSSAPVAADFTPSGVPDGFIWVDFDGAMTSNVNGATAVFTNDAPTSSLTTGLIWVDKDATTSTVGNPFIPQAIIAAKGDLLAGSANDTVVVLTVGSNGTYLKADSSTASGLTWASAGDVTLTGAQTLTDKTLTSPVLGGITTTASGNLVVEPATKILEIRGSGATVGQIQLNCPVNSHGQIIASQPHSEAATNTLTLPGGNTIGNGNATLVSDTGTQTLTNKTLTTPTINTPAISRPTITGTTQIAQILESAAVTSFSVTGTVTHNVLDQGAVVYYTNSSSANYVLNVTGSSTTSLANLMSTGQSLTIASLVTNGAGAARYLTALQIDGTAATSITKWQGGTAPSSGNTSSIDIYSITAIKTANTSTIASAFTVFAAQTQFK